jgi:N utilization substance protein A
MKGSRINAVIRDLRGEKIDIIAYSDDIVEYTINALNPAKISKVLVADPVEKVLEVIVPEDQLSLAIGRKGQNVRLASRLLGWEIDIKSEGEKKQEVLDRIDRLEEPKAVSPLSLLEGVGEVLRNRLQEAGIESIEDLASRGSEELKQIPGVGEKKAEKLLAGATDFVAQVGSDKIAREEE